MTLRKRPRSGTGSPKVLFGEDKASSRPLISGAVRNAVYGPGGAAPAALTAEYLVVAGGGGGASAYGGGGAGGYRTATDFSFSLGTAYTLTVGAGAPADAAGGPLGSQGGDGGNSTFATITSTGGGGGSSYDSATPGPLADGRDGGSGGGGGYTPAGSSGGSGNTPAVTPSQGNDGGSGSPSAPYYGAGGGGGAGAIGANGTSTNGGAGGAGLESFITGSSVYRAGGGGGGNYSANNGGAGGIGGGGNAGSAGVAGAAGAANTGGGGGGGHAGAAGVGAWTGGGAGGSGVVIIKVPSTIVAEFSAGVVYNYIPLDDFNVYEITAAGVSDTVTFSQGALATVNESLLFNDNAGSHMTRTASTGNLRTYTFSAWAKFTVRGSDGWLFAAGGSSAPLRWGLYRKSNGQIVTDLYGIGEYNSSLALYRDPSAWYHIVWTVDTTAPTAIDRSVIYINGKRIADANTRTLALNSDTTINRAITHYIGNSAPNPFLLDGCLSDVYFIDGEAHDPSRFGKQDADGIWQPIVYTGNYGTNGFHLDFADNSTVAALGTDTSGNGNNWTPVNLTTGDQVTDTPSVNYATLNPLDWNITYLDDGNLYAYNTFGAWQLGRGNFGVSSGKWYWEATGATANVMVGIATSKAGLGSYVGQDAYGWGYYGTDGYKYNNGTWIAYGATYTSTDVIGVAFDADNGTLEFYKNGTSQGTAFTGLTNGPYFPALSVYNSAVRHNFGQTPFAHTPPTGFQALNSANLPAPTITDGKAHFDISVYTGNGTTQAIGGLEFQPDMVWIKSRSTAYDHQLHDAVRGAGIGLLPNLTVAEQPTYNTVTSFNSDGFTVAVNGSFVGTNAAGSTFVGWAWNAGGSTVTNTDGTITSQVRANTDAGISIVSWTGNGVVDSTIGHGLNAAPKMIITKNRSFARSWAVYHEAMGYFNEMYLDLTQQQTASNFWRQDPTSSVFTVSSSNYVNANTNTYIGYAFAEVDGFSKFGSYTGNGSADGPFVYTGFRPAFVMVKRTDAAGYNWAMMDSERSPYNRINSWLYANLTNAQDTSLRDDLLSNGFKVRQSGAGINASGGTYIFMAFAENPFKTARAR